MPSTISYADLPARWGISFYRTDNILRIIFPPTRRIGDLPIGYKIGVPYLLLTTATPILMISVSPPPPPISPVIFNVIFYFIILVLVLLAAARRLFGRKMVELDSQHLSVSWLIANRPSGIRRWPRERIGLAKRNVSTGQLVIYVVGKTLVDIDIGSDPMVTDWVASEIMSALQILPAHVVPIETKTPSDDDLPEPMPKSRARSALIGIACMLSISGLLIACMGGPRIGVAMIPFFLAAVPAGFAMGMQDKQGRYM